MRRQLPRILLGLTTLLLANPTLGLELFADERPATKDKAYLLTCPADEQVWKLPPKDIHWEELQRILDDKAAKIIQIVDRGRIDSSLYIDTEGLRLYVASAECRTRFERLASDSQDQITLPYLVQNLLLRRYGETSVEPDRIPVRGSACSARNLPNERLRGL